MTKGWVKLYREITSHWLYEESRVFSKFEAWIDLVISASHQERKMMSDGNLITVERGCVVTSVRSLCQRWSWSNSKVSKFLSLLESDGMIIRRSDTKNTLITLINYEKFQGDDDVKATPKRHSGDTQATPRRHSGDTQATVSGDAEKTGQTLDTYSFSDHQDDGEATLRRHSGDTEATPKRHIKELKNVKNGEEDLNNTHTLTREDEIQDSEKKAAVVSLFAEQINEKPPFKYQGKLKVLDALNYYDVSFSGFLKLEQIESYQGMMDDELILAAVKESGGQNAGYCLSVIKAWHRKGWLKITDHPDLKPKEGGDSGRTQSSRGGSWRTPGNGRSSSGFDQVKSTNGKQVWPKREENF